MFSFLIPLPVTLCRSWWSRPKSQNPAGVVCSTSSPAALSGSISTTRSTQRMMAFLSTPSGSQPVSPVHLLQQHAAQCVRAARPALGSAVLLYRRSWRDNGWLSSSKWAQKDSTTTRDFSRTRASSSFQRWRIGGPASSLSCWVIWPRHPLWPWDEQVSCLWICWGGTAWGQASWCPKWGFARPQHPASYRKSADGAGIITSCRSPSGTTRWRG